MDHIETRGSTGKFSRRTRKLPPKYFASLVARGGGIGFEADTLEDLTRQVGLYLVDREPSQEDHPSEYDDNVQVWLKLKHACPHCGPRYFP